MKTEKIIFFESSLLCIVQSPSGQTVSFQLNTQKLFLLLVASLLLFILLGSGTLLFFKERNTNETLSQKTILNHVTSTSVENVKEQEKIVATSKPRIQDFSGSCHENTCSANLTLMAQEPLQSQGSLLILLETQPPQIGSGNPIGKIRQKYYAYPAQDVKENLLQDDVFSLKTKPFFISRSLTSKAIFTVGRFQRPIAFHLYLFNENHELIKQELLPINGEEKNDP